LRFREIPPGKPSSKDGVHWGNTAEELRETHQRLSKILITKHRQRAKRNLSRAYQVFTEHSETAL
jgi:hypothetical protein